MALTNKLTAIADSIRDKTGTTDKLTLDQMPQAIANIETSTEDSDDKFLAKTKVSYSTNLTEIRDYCFRNNNYISSFNAPNLLKIPNYCFSVAAENLIINCPAAKEIGINSLSSYAVLNTPNVTTLANDALGTQYYSQIEPFLQNITTAGNNFMRYITKIPVELELSLPNLESLGDCAFYSFNYTLAYKSISLPKITKLNGSDFGGTSVEKIDIPNVVTIGTNEFINTQRLSKIVLPKVISIGRYMFDSRSVCETLVLQAESVCTLGGILSSASNDKISSGTGYIYVPQSLIEDYKVATNWSLYADQFRAIEDYPEVLEVDIDD